MAGPAAATLSDTPFRLALAHGRLRWPRLVLSGDVFAVYLARRMPADAVLAESILGTRAADLYLACACSNAIAGAVASFEALYFSEVDAVARRLSGRCGSVDDLRQCMHERVFLGSTGHPAKINSYAGTGDLRHWFRVTTMRVALNLGRGKPPLTVSDSLLLEQSDGSDDPELSYIKRRYRAEFKLAFTAALAALSAREQSLLRYTVDDGLDAEAVASIYRVHRTTVIRWLQGAHRTLHSALRAEIVRCLGVSPAELESLLRLIRSRLEITLQGIRE